MADAGPYSIASLGRDALSIMDALGVAKTHWLGLSLGGMVGQWLLAHAPDRIDRVVLANTSSHIPDPRPYNARVLAVRKNGMASIAQTVVDRWFTPDFQTRDPAAVERITDMLRTTPAQGYMAACAAVRDMDQRETVRAARRPDPRDNRNARPRDSAGPRARHCGVDPGREICRAERRPSLERRAAGRVHGRGPAVSDRSHITRGARRWTTGAVTNRA